MRIASRHNLWHIGAALLLGAAATFLVELAGSFATTLVLLVFLSWLSAIVLAMLRARMATHRFPPRRRPRNRGNGWDTSGVREPRRPRPPYMPPAAAAADPDPAHDSW